MSENINEKQQSSQSDQKPGELYLLFMLLLVFVLFFYEALKNKGIMEGKISGPGIIPQLIAVGSIIMIFILFMQFISNHYKEAKVFEVIETLFSKDLIVIIVAVVLYALLLEKFKFILTSAVFLFFSMIALEPKKIINKLLISTVTLAFIVFIFKYVFQVVLP